MKHSGITEDYILQHAFKNIYGLTMDNIDTLHIINWERLHTLVLTMPHSEVHDTWCCHVEGCNLDDEEYCYENECLFLFEKSDGSIRCLFSSCRGLCKYDFRYFYDTDTIRTRQELGVQVNALKFLTTLIQENIIGF